MKMCECIFCKIAAREITSKIINEDDQCVVFEDASPQAPVHFLVIPRKHISSLNDARDEDRNLLGHLICVAARTAKEKGIDGSGYRAIINTNAEAGQTVFHIHIHILGGRLLGWPPG